ncbi:Uncharacterised protein [Collinsella intestinalis]|nr:Uncharacterised protein [Collinsella intestinalis]
MLASLVGDFPILLCGRGDELVRSALQSFDLAHGFIGALIELDPPVRTIPFRALGEHLFAVQLPMPETNSRDARTDPVDLLVLPIFGLGIVCRSEEALADGICRRVDDASTEPVVHRSRNVEDEDDVERAARGRSGVGSRREGRQADQEVGLSLLDDGLDATGKPHIIIRDGLVRPDAADVLRVLMGDALPRRDRRWIHDRGLLSLGPRRSPVSRSCLRGWHHRCQCKRCAQHNRGQHLGQTPYR